ASGRRLFPPSPGIDYVHAPVAIDVADADTVQVAPRTLFRDSVNNPWPGGIGGIGLRITDVALGSIDQFRFAVAINISCQSDFQIERGNHLVTVPAPGFPLWIHIQGWASAS